MSKQHLMSAVHFGELAYSHERRGQADRRTLIEHRAYVSAAILCAVASSEANVNEVFADATDDNLDEYPQLSESQKAELRKIWQQKKPDTTKLSIVRKYQAALKGVGAQPLDPDRGPLREVWLLGQLRNALTHYEPKWLEIPLSNTRIEPKHWLEELLANKFPPSSLAAPGSTPFPDQILGYGCARWAVLSSVTLSHEFVSRLSMARKFRGARALVEEMPAPPVA